MERRGRPEVDRITHFEWRGHRGGIQKPSPVHDKNRGDVRRGC